MINELMKRLSELPNVTMDDGQEYIQLYDAMETVKRALEQEPCEDAISRQAVMNCFKKWQPYMATRLHEFEKELSEMPSVAIPSAEPCEDAISRKVLLSHIENQSREWGEDYDVQQILGDIEDMPSVKPQEPKKEKYDNRWFNGYAN